MASDGPEREQTRSDTPGRGQGAVGGDFLWVDRSAEEIFLPEDLSEETRAIADLTHTFAQGRILPRMAELEHHDLALLKTLVGQAGELGILSVEIPAAYGGSGLGRVAATAVVEALAPTGGFAVTQAAHSGLAMLPIALFGTPTQRERYLPDLARGSKVAGYALTEPGYGSDALKGRTAAQETPDGGYRLTGQKQWITNSGIADLWVVFAQLADQGFTAFLVERDTEGLSTGPEYEKLGIRSSSTRPLILEDVKIPRDHLLGRPGRGHEIALSVLDVSRLNLGAGAVGSSKWLLQTAVNYAKGRMQFGRPIAQFGLIREKLARIEVRLWALEAAVYRTAGLIEGTVQENPDAGEAAAASEFALECAIVKVLGSEVLDFVADEALQIHGGYGYMVEYPVERAYRDARINRIFEGTNEINRLTIPETLLRRAARGRVPLTRLRAELPREIADLRRPTFFDAPLGAERFAVSCAKKAFWLAAGLALDRIGGTPEALAEEEETLGALADVSIAIFMAESALARAERSCRKPSGHADQGPMARRLAALAIDEAVGTVAQAAERVISHTTTGDARLESLSLLRRLTRRDPTDGIDALRTVADLVLERGGFVS